MPGRWIKVPPRTNIPETICETPECERKSLGHQFCIECFRVKTHHHEFCDDCGVCHEDVIENCAECQWINDGWGEPFKLCDGAKCKHKWNPLNYRLPVVNNEYRKKGCTCVTDGIHEKGRPCKVHLKAIEVGT